VGIAHPVFLIANPDGEKAGPVDDLSVFISGAFLFMCSKISSPSGCLSFMINALRDFALFNSVQFSFFVSVIPSKEGIHVVVAIALARKVKVKMDSRLRGNDRAVVYGVS
jgi:hypothetical protein